MIMPRETTPLRMKIPVDEEPLLSPKARAAMARAREAQEKWSKQTLTKRLALVRELRRLIALYDMELATASASARGRPVREALTAEVLPLAEACRFLEREGRRALAPRRLGKAGRPAWLPGVSRMVYREPFGVVLVIGPGNYPLLLPGVQTIQALSAGNAVFLKPGRGGFASAKLLVDLILRAGFDARLVTLLSESIGEASAIVAARPDKVVFTGSAATGRKILRQLAGELIPSTMELSGCDAVIIRADADLDLAARALRFGLTLNDGATCMSPKRVFVPASRAVEFEECLTRILAPVATEGRPGRASGGLAPTQLGETNLPLLVREALAGGARLVCGRVEPEGIVQTPLVLWGVPPTSCFLRADVFGSALAVIIVGDDQEALRRANDCPFALGAGIFSRDEVAARELAFGLNVGVVTINDLIVPTADAALPFGGRGRSGFGVTRGPEGLLELTTPKVVTVTRGRFRPAFEAPRAGDERLFHCCMQLAHGRGLITRLGGLISLVRAVLSRRKRLSEA